MFQNMSHTGRVLRYSAQSHHKDVFWAIAAQVQVKRASARMTIFLDAEIQAGDWH
jgi:hypothetical protein